MQSKAETEQSRTPTAKSCLNCSYFKVCAARLSLTESLILIENGINQKFGQEGLKFLNQPIQMDHADNYAKLGANCTFYWGTKDFGA